MKEREKISRIMDLAASIIVAAEDHPAFDGEIWEMRNNSQEDFLKACCNEGGATADMLDIAWKAEQILKLCMNI